MNTPIGRRSVVLGLAAAVAAPAAAARLVADPRLADLERRAGGRLGVTVLDGKGCRVAGHRGDERFLLCSTFKPFLAGLVLARVEAGIEQLDRRVPVTRDDLVSHAPAVEAALGEGVMTVEALAAAAVTVSDNAAANLLLATLGGPAGLTRFFRRLGARGARLDRLEPDLNRPFGGLDTTTPAEAAAMLRVMLGHSILGRGSQALLEGWMIDSPTGRARLRAGLPPAWRAGDKTGSGGAGETNDVAFVDVPGRGRLTVAAYYDSSPADRAVREAVLAEVGRIVAAL